MSTTWKATYITLIPKVQSLVRTKDYRPIGLCSTLYNVVVKFIMCRLKPILPRLVLKEQATF